MIRQFQSADAVDCSKLIHACLQKDLSLSPLLREKMRQQETSERMLERNRLFYTAVYESKNRILGIVGLDMNEIRLLYVSPDHQYQGIGRALVDHIQSMTPGAFFQDIFVYSSLPSVGFYKACGFGEKGPFHFNFDGWSIPTVFLTFKIGAIPPVNLIAEPNAITECEGDESSERNNLIG
jgi:N-acetylglutamate synthase-like GNAT family acetyltransferase